MEVIADTSTAVGAKSFDPNLHPRDEHGRFAETPEGGLGAITAGNTDAGAIGAEKLANDLSPEERIIAYEQSHPESLIPAPNPGIQLKIDNVHRIGAALAERAKSDLALKAQLDTVGDRVLSAVVSAGNALQDLVPAMTLEDGVTVGHAYGYQLDHLQLEPGMTLTEVGGREVAAKLQDTWMNSASDDNSMSWGLQLAVGERVGVNTTEAEAYLTLHTSSAGGQDATVLGVDVPRTEDYGPFGMQASSIDTAKGIAASPAVKAYVDQVYSDTQKYLDNFGITEVSVFRGVEFPLGDDSLRTGSADPQDRRVVLNPLSSFSTSEETARTFAIAGGAPGQYVLETTVPAERVFALPTTGPGCLNETELLVVGGPAMARVTPIEHSGPSGGAWYEPEDPLA
jgi:hypothetical protein